MKKFTRRDYQDKAIAQSAQCLFKDKKRTLLIAPTGAGKTVMARGLVERAIGLGYRVVFLTHRESLVQQTLNTMEGAAPVLGVLKSGYPRPKNPSAVDVWVVGIQSFRRRVIPWGQGGKPSLIIYDEAHTSRWYRSTQRIVEEAREGSPGVAELGLTATPWRLSPREWMGQYFDEVVHTVNPRKLIESRYLTPFSYWGWGGFDRDSLEIGDSGDYTMESLNAATLNEDYLDKSIAQLFEALESHLDIPNPRFACFCVTQEQAHLLAERVAARVGEDNVAVVLGDTPPSDRDDLYQWFSDGPTPQFLFGCGCFAEGWDCPPCNGIALFRPTRSKALYVQICGRAARVSPGKDRAYILDFSGTVQDLGYIEDLCESFQDVLSPPPAPPEREAKPQGEKDCPQCQAIVLSSAKVCPHCGYQFEADDPKPTRKPTLPGFGKILSKPNQQAMKKLRARRWKLYKGNRDPEQFRAWARGQEAGGETNINLEDPALLWGVCHSVRETDPFKLTAAYWEFEHYLRQFRSIRPYLDWHLEAEFGPKDEPKYSQLLEFEIPPYQPLAPYQPPLTWLGLGAYPSDVESVLEVAQSLLSQSGADPAAKAGILWGMGHVVDAVQSYSGLGLDP